MTEKLEYKEESVTTVPVQQVIEDSAASMDEKLLSLLQGLGQTMQNMNTQLSKINDKLN